MFRCLNPDSNEDPTKWGAYNPNQFANALSKEFDVSNNVIYTFRQFVQFYHKTIFIQEYMLNDGRN